MNKRITIAVSSFVLIFVLACAWLPAGTPAVAPTASESLSQPTVVVLSTPMIPAPSSTPNIVSPTPNAALSCPVAVQVAPGSAFNRYTFVQGQTYHLNLSLEGAPAGVEGNLLFVATQTFTVDFDGAAWSYNGSITASDCQYCQETLGDYTLTLANVPQLAGLIEVLSDPCTTGIGSTTLPVHFLEVVSVQSQADSCPVAVQVAPGSAFNRYTFVQGQTYHLNLSLEGAPAGVEGNLLFVATQTFTVDFDGAAWSYNGSITASDCQYCQETLGDYTLTLANVPQLAGLIEVLSDPCTTGIGSTTLPVHFLEVVQ